MTEHFPGCHPGDDEAPSAGPRNEAAVTEDCWHCGTPTSQGCNCADCFDSAGYIPPSLIYHCQTCRRWWAWTTGLSVMTMTIPGI